MRYVASTLRGAFLEVLQQFRPKNAETTELLDGVEHVDDGDTKDADIGKFLDTQRVARCQVVWPIEPMFVSIHDPKLQVDLGRSPEVVAVFERLKVMRMWGPHIDQGTVRLGDLEFGRPLTQACASVIHRLDPRPAGIQYSCKYDDTEVCWAIFDHVSVVFTESEPLNPRDSGHRAAISDVADLWQIKLPEAWTREGAFRGNTAHAPPSSWVARARDERRVGVERRRRDEISLETSRHVLRVGEDRRIRVRRGEAH